MNFLLLAVALVAGGQLRFHAVYTDHMVFQRDSPIVLKGYASSDAEIGAMLGTARAVGRADAQGRWTLELPAMRAGGPYAVTVRSGNETAMLKDVLVGEVWLCSGQSNMEMPVWNDNAAYRLTNGLEVAAAADDPELRLVQINRTEGDRGPVEEPGTDPRWWKGWQRADTAEAVKPFSATAYCFGRELRRRLGVPVGIVASSWGGTQIRPWIGSERKDGYEPVRYNGMIAPLRGLQFRGVAWYQGCADKENWRQYDEWQHALVSNWRETFGRPDLAFVCVQLAGNLRNTPGKPFSSAEIAALEPSEEGAVNIRAVQARFGDMPGCACVTAADLGDAHDVHAKNKYDVGARLAAAAEDLCYGGKTGVCGPQVTSAVRDGRAVVVRFDVPIVVKGGAFGPQEFTLAGVDGRRVWARAKQIAPNAVRIESDAVGDPDKVDYGWNPYSPSMSIRNAEGFPAFPFRYGGLAQKVTEAFERGCPVWFADKAALADVRQVTIGKWVTLDEEPTFVRVASDRPVRFHFSWRYVGWIPGDGKAHDFPILNGRGKHEFKLEIPSDATYVCAEIYKRDGTRLAWTAETHESGDTNIRSWFRKNGAAIPLVAAEARAFACAEGFACRPSLLAFAPPADRHWIYRLEPGRPFVFSSSERVKGVPTASVRCNEPGVLLVKWGDAVSEQVRVVAEKAGDVGFTVHDPVVFDRLEFIVERGRFEVFGVGATTLVDLDLALSSLVTSDQKLNAEFAEAKSANDRTKAFGILKRALGVTRLDKENRIFALDPTVKNGLSFCGAKFCVGVDEDEVIDWRWMREGTEGLATDSGKLPVGWKAVRDFDMQSECQRLVDKAVEDGLSPGLQFCAYRDGKCIVNVFAGKLAKTPDSPFVRSDSLFPIFSTEKPLLATACHRAVERGLMDYDKPLCTWWPELRGDGKEKLTLRETLAYRTCLPGGSPGGKGNPVCGHAMSERELCDWDRVCRVAAADKPNGVPGTTQAYLPYAYAWMIGHPLEVAMKKPLNEVLTEEVLKPSGIEREFYFVVPRSEYPRVAEYYDGAFCENMNFDWCRQALMPSAWAVSSAEALCRFYNRLNGFDGLPPLIRRDTLDAALLPCRHPNDPLPNAKSMKRDFFMIFGMGYGLWGEAERMDRVFGHGGAGGSEALVDRDQRLIVAYTCNSCKDSTVLRDRLYEVVGMRWRYWKGGANIQDLQMTTSAGGRFGAGITSH